MTPTKKHHFGPVRATLARESELVTRGFAAHRMSDELAELLRRQHAELRTMLCRVPLLHDGAREDVFLRARRLLAVHLELESALLLPRLDGVPDHFRLDEEVEAAEQRGLESIEFDAAQARVAVAFLRHVGVLEGLTLKGQLSAREEEVVATATRLWDGFGEAYLGNTWSDMVAAASESLSSADCGCRSAAALLSST